MANEKRYITDGFSGVNIAVKGNEQRGVSGVSSANQSTSSKPAAGNSNSAKSQVTKEN